MEKIFTPSIISTIIISVSIIIVLIALCITYYKCNRKTIATNYKEKSLQLHMIYVVTILILSIICLITHNYCSNDDAYTAISFASTLVSIILAVLTIVYSYYINSRSTGQIDILNKAAQDVSNATREYGDSAELLSRLITSILSAIEGVKNDTSQLLNNANSATSTSGEDNISDIDVFLDNYIRSGSVSGCLLLYACCLAYNKGEKFNVNIISPLSDQQMYYIGYVVASSSIGIINTRVDFTANEISVISCHDKLKIIIEKWFKDPELNEKYPTVQGDINQINKHFNI